MPHTPHTAGACDGWTPGPYTPDQCRPCWKANNRATSRRPDLSPVANGHATVAAGGPLPLPPCVHLGEETRREQCLTCGGRVMLRVLACEVHGEATVGKRLEGVPGCCTDCERYSARKTDLAPLFRAARYRAVCINLARRPDRWSRFSRECPIANVERFEAIDCKAPTAPRPDWWDAGHGAWGCYLSHQAVLRQAIADGFAGDDVLLMLEDDPVFDAAFEPRVTAFLAAVPGDWDLIYLGGQHLSQRRPQPVNLEVVRGWKVNRAHAYAVRGSFLRRLAAHLKHCEDNRVSPAHVDHWMQRLHSVSRVYCPAAWIVGQHGGVSDIGKSVPEDRFWR
jgi:hypothetical protein